MSLSTNVANLATRVATEVKAIRTLVNGNVADLSGLTTTAKANLVAAVNELDSAINAIDLTDLIDDTVTASTTTWSSTKINSEVQGAVAALVDGAPELLDTLNELAAAINDDEDFVTTITGQISAAQTAAQNYADSVAQTAETNANNYTDGEITTLENAIGDTDSDYVATFEAGLV